MELLQRGSTLLEGLIAAAILSIGVLGIVALQANLISYGSKAQYRLDASLLASEVIGMVLADSVNANCYVYVAPTFGQAGCASATATGYMTTWVAEVATKLPNSTVVTSLTAAGVYTVTLTWRHGVTDTYTAVTNIGG